MDADLAKLSPNERSELMDKVKTQVLVANFQEMLTVSIFLLCTPVVGLK